MLVPIADQTIAEEQTLTLQVQATDPDGDPLLYSATNLPPGATFDPVAGVLTWTPNLFQAGTYSGIVLGASDGYLTTTRDPHDQRDGDQPAAEARPAGRAGRPRGDAAPVHRGGRRPRRRPLTYSAISGLPAGAPVQRHDRPVQLDPDLRPGGRLHDRLRRHRSRRPDRPDGRATSTSTTSTGRPPRS